MSVAEKPFFLRRFFKASFVRRKPIHKRDDPEMQEFVRKLGFPFAFSSSRRYGPRP
jgi:hypothetical protein